MFKEVDRDFLKGYGSFGQFSLSQVSGTCMVEKLYIMVNLKLKVADADAVPLKPVSKIIFFFVSRFRQIIQLMAAISKDFVMTGHFILTGYRLRQQNVILVLFGNSSAGQKLMENPIYAILRQKYSKSGALQISISRLQSFEPDYNQLKSKNVLMRIF